MQDLSTTIGRIVFSAVMIVFGLMHMMAGGDMAPMVPIPPQTFWIYFTGAALIAAGIAIIIQKMAMLASTLLALMLLIFALTLHLPGALDGDQSAMSNFLKDLALAAAALFFGGYFAGNEGLPEKSE